MTEPGKAVSARLAAPAASTAAAAEGSLIEDEEEEDAAAEPGPEPRPGLLVTLSLGWLAVILWVAHASIIADTVQLGLVTAAIALPTVVAASLLAGGAAGLTATSVLASRRARRGASLPKAREEHWLTRLGAATPAGLVTGGLAAGAILLTFGTQGSVAVLALAVGTAGAIGGGLTAAVPRAVAAAGLAAALGVFVTAFAFNLFRHRLRGVFGAGESAASQLSADRWVSLTVAAVGALVAGLVAFWHLRRTARAAQPTATPPLWPAYLIAGAIPGVLLLLSEAVTRIGGRHLLALAGSVSELDRTALGWAGDSRVNYALVILFFGAVTATIAFGRTLPTRPRDDD